MMLRLDRVTRRYGSLVAVDGVSLSLATGERHAVVGPNGAGKTTLLDLVAGAIRPHAGRIVWGGRDVTRVGAVGRAKLGIIRTHQQPAVWPALTALDNVVVGGWRFGGRRAALQILDSVGLADAARVPAGELSHGQRRLLELAIALAGNPKLLVLDEPTAGLFPAEVDQLTKLLANLPTDVTVLMVEHHLEFACAVTEVLTVMQQGRAVN
jgi:branched-chain amino acid transport system ATP-binding protein